MSKVQPASHGNRPLSDALLTEIQAAKYLGLTPRALQAWRYQGYGPRFVKISGRCIRYRASDLEQWVTGRLRRSTSDRGESRMEEEA